jgi:hypothetical protein
LIAFAVYLVAGIELFALFELVTRGDLFSRGTGRHVDHHA